MSSEIWSFTDYLRFSLDSVQFLISSSIPFLTNTLKPKQRIAFLFDLVETVSNFQPTSPKTKKYTNEKPNQLFRNHCEIISIFFREPNRNQNQNSICFGKTKTRLELNMKLSTETRLPTRIRTNKIEIELNTYIYKL